MFFSSAKFWKQYFGFIFACCTYFNLGFCQNVGGHQLDLIDWGQVRNKLSDEFKKLTAKLIEIFN